MTSYRCGGGGDSEAETTTAVMRSHATRPRRVRMARRRPGRSRGDRLGRRRRSRARLPASSPIPTTPCRQAVRANASRFEATLPGEAYDEGLWFGVCGLCFFIVTVVYRFRICFMRYRMFEVPHWLSGRLIGRISGYC